MTQIINAGDVARLAPGRKAWIVRQFTPAQGEPFEVRVGVIRGARPGPVMAQVAGQHGTEHLGPIILRDLFDQLDPRQMAGTLYICPAANPRALELDYEIFPEFHDLSKLKEYFFSPARPGYCVFGLSRGEGRTNYNMNRLWPDGNTGGNGPAGVANQIVAWLWQVMIEPAQVVVDHHALRAAKPQVFVEDPSAPWAAFLGIEGVYSRPMPEKLDPYMHGVLSLQAIRHGKIGLTIEYSQQRGLKEHERPLGRFAVENLMRATGMLAGPPEFPRQIWLLGNRFNPPEFITLRSEKVGHLHFADVEEYQPLTRGQLIAEVRNIATHAVLDRIVAPADCLVLTRTWRPVNKPGEEICRVHTAPKLLAGPGKPITVPNLPVLERV